MGMILTVVRVYQMLLKRLRRHFVGFRLEAAI